MGFLFTPKANLASGDGLVLMPTSGNVSKEDFDEAQYYSSLGLTTLLVDPFYSSNVSGGLVSPLQSLVDNEVILAYAARQLLQTHPYLKSGKIGLGGMSRGATVTDLASRHEYFANISHDRAPFDFYFGYYPSFIALPQHYMVAMKPMLYFTGDQDPFVDVPLTRMHILKLLEAGVPYANLEVYEGVSHGFNYPSNQIDVDNDFPIFSAEKAGFIYDKDGFTPIRGGGKQSWDNLFSFLSENYKNGFKTEYNALAAKLARSALENFLTEHVELKIHTS